MAMEMAYRYVWSLLSSATSTSGKSTSNFWSCIQGGFHISVAVCHIVPQKVFGPLVVPSRDCIRYLRGNSLKWRRQTIHCNGCFSSVSNKRITPPLFLPRYMRRICYYSVKLHIFNHFSTWFSGLKWKSRFDQLVSWYVETHFMTSWAQILPYRPSGRRSKLRESLHVFMKISKFQGRCGNSKYYPTGLKLFVLSFGMVSQLFRTSHHPKHEKLDFWYTLMYIIYIDWYIYGKCQVLWYNLASPKSSAKIGTICSGVTLR